MKRTKTQKDYNYKPVTILFDLDLVEEKQLFDWLKEHKDKNNGYGVQIKKAIKEMVERMS